GSCGKPTTNTELRVARDDGQDAAPGEIGEILIRSLATMVGYWNRPNESAETLAGGWLHTGDLGVLDDEGFLTICRRQKDTFISGGLNVYPAEIESVLLAEPGIAECAVVGIPDDRWGETGYAFFVPAPGARLDVDMLLKRCRDRLAHYKVPKGGEVLDAPLP